MDKVSVIIPARNEPYLQNTIDDLYAKAGGEIEVIVVLDGWWPKEALSEYLSLVVLHKNANLGMRAAINDAARIATGGYLMKVDAHCAFCQGFDTLLKESCQQNWVVIPRRYKLKVDTWERDDRKVYDFQYMRKLDLKGKDWPEYAERVEDQIICDTMTMQGSCWFTHKSFYDGTLKIDNENYGSMGKEAQEISLKAWLSGGRVVVHRGTWYAHWSKSKEHVIRGMGDEKRKSSRFLNDYWRTYQSKQYEHDLAWLVQKFYPVPTWEDDKPSIEIADVLHQKFNPDDSKAIPIKVRRFNRKHLAKLFGVLGYTKGAEIGVRQGNYSRVLLNNNEKLEKLYCIDPWEAYAENPRSLSAEQDKAFYNETKEKLSKYLGVFIIREFSMSAIKQFKKGSLDFVYIDGNHVFDYVMQDIIEWSKIVRPGGIVAGHDYYRFRRGGVKEAVDVYVKMHNIKEFFVTDESAPSFFWVKKSE